MQRHLHEKIEDHARRNGRVRVLILKARQQGCSTYVGARFYHKATHNRGQQVFILTHEQDATDNLFDMAQSVPRSLSRACETSYRSGQCKGAVL